MQRQRRPQLLTRALAGQGDLVLVVRREMVVPVRAVVPDAEVHNLGDFVAPLPRGVAVDVAVPFDGSAEIYGVVRDQLAVINILHRRTWPLEFLFWRHTPEHHVIFVRDDMAMRETREFRLVLIPFYGIVAIFVLALPITAALWFPASPNLALLWVASTMGYVVSYEWLHLAYHLPDANPIGRSPLIRRLRRHHAVHHTPELMQRWNVNVTVPLGDWLLGTIHPDTRRA